jgi:hypothetical protein
MEADKSIIKSADSRMTTFVEKGIETLEGAMQVANFLLESKIIPYHYYEKLPDGKPDFTKGKVGAVAGVLVHGIGTLHLPAMTALQNIIPINGLLTIKGDLAKSMIFSSGKLRKDSWKESITGSIEGEDMEVTITATREDNGLTLSKSFSINDAKRAGLWITSQQVNGTDGWKFKSSPWWKYQKRMLYYRPLGYLARDLFGDVLNNMYITEEAQDMTSDVSEVIETPDGTKITIPDKVHSQERSGKLTGKVIKKLAQEEIVDAIKGTDVTPIKQTVMSPTVINESHPETVNDPPIESHEEEITHPDFEEASTTGLTLKQMEDMPTIDLLAIVNKDSDMIEAMEIIPGKNTNKKLREIIFAHQEGKLAEYIVPYLNDERKPEGSVPPPQTEVKAGNKYNLAIPDYDKGDQREFSTCKAIFNALLSVNPPIDNPRWLELARKAGLSQKYQDKETFIKFATTDEINKLIDGN